MKKIDVALASPPFDFSNLNSSPGRGSRHAGYYLYYPPEGLCSIAASLREAGFSVEIIDGQADAESPENLVRMIADMAPSIVGITVTTPALPVVKKIIADIRARAGSIVVVGGPHVSCDPMSAISLGADYGVAGDGELLMTSLAETTLRSGTIPEPQDGLTICRSRAVCERPAIVDIAQLPLPARDLLKHPDAYFNAFTSARTSMTLTARGCPFRCSFCCRVPSMSDHRPLPVDRTVRDMISIRDAGAGFVSLIDETFTFDRDRTLEIMREMKKARTGFKWSCQTRADLVDEVLLGEMRGAGCINISFGLETGGETARGQLDKGISDDSFDRAFSLCRRAGISVNAFVIIGNPTETRDQVDESIRRVIELNPDYAVFNIGTLFPGSREYERRVESGEASREIWDRLMDGDAALPLLSRTMEREELVGLLKKAYSKFYLRPGFVAGRIAGIRSLKDAAVLARQARTVLSDYVADSGAKRS